MTKKNTRPLFPKNINDAEIGVVYSDKWGGACISQLCEVCNKPRMVTLRHGVPVSTKCGICSNRTIEKREIMSRHNIGKKWDAEIVERRAIVIRVSCNTPEYKALASAIRIGIPKSEESKKKQSLTKTGKKLTPQHCEAIRKASGILFEDEEYKQNFINKMNESKNIANSNRTPEDKSKIAEKLRIATKKRWENSEYRAFMSEQSRKNWLNLEYRSMMINTMTNYWANPEYKDKTMSAVFKGLALKPTKPEVLLDILLQEYFVDQWIYNGDNSCNFKIDGKVPDFLNLNGINKVIELFSVHHCPMLFPKVLYHRTPKGRIELYKKFGYDCLIIWEQELNNLELVIQKVKEFIEAG